MQKLSILLLIIWSLSLNCRHVLERKIYKRDVDVDDDDVSDLLLDKVPGILEKHEVSLDSIADNILKFESSLVNAFSSGLTQLSETIEDSVPEIKNVMQEGFHEVSENNHEMISALEGMTSAITNGNSLIGVAIKDANDQLTDAFEDGSGSISASIRVGNEKIAETNKEIAKEITVGNTKIAENIDDTKGSIDTLKSDLVNSVNNNRDALVSVKQAIDFQKMEIEDSLDAVGVIVQNAANSKTQILSDINQNLEKSADSLKQSGVDTKDGLMILVKNMEAMSSEMGALASSIATGSVDNKVALKEVAEKIAEASGHLQQSAIFADTLASTLNHFATETKNSIDALSTSVETSGNTNKNSLDGLKDAIRDFVASETSNADRIIDALNIFKDSLGEGSTGLKIELDSIENAIKDALHTDIQFKAVRRLADKIECTQDCMMSSDQSDAVIQGLDFNDQNMERLITNINDVAANVPTDQE